MRCPVLIGREVELAAVRHLIESSAAGTGQAMFLTGEPGIGKSALLRSAVLSAQVGRVETMIGRAVPSSSSLPFRPLAEAVLSSLRHAKLPDSEDLLPFRPALARLIPHWRVAYTEPPDSSPVVLGEGLIRLWRLINPQGCVLALDDLQWADTETLEVVEYLCDNLAGEPIGFLGVARDFQQPQLIEALRARRSATVLHLEPLRPPAVLEMIGACPMPDDFPAEATSEVVAAAEGVPLLVEEVLSLAADPARRSTTGVPATVAETVRQRLVGLDRRMFDALVCAALLGRSFDWRLLLPASGIKEYALHEGLRRAIDLQLLDSDGDSFRFRHALTRDAVLGAVLPPERSALAAATRAAVEAAHPGLPGEWCILGAELDEQAGDRDGAAALLVTAGGRALRQAALGTAERLLRRAASLSTGPDTAADADEHLAEVLAAAGQIDEAVDIARGWLAVGRPEPARRARMQLLLARAAIAGERWELAAAQLESSRAVARNSLGVAAEHDALSAQVAMGLGRIEQAAALALSAVGAATSSARPEVACEALEVIGRGERLRSLPAARATFERSEALAEANGLAFWRMRALHELGTVDMFENGQLDRLVRARALAVEAGALTTVAVLDVQLAGGWWLCGEAADCLAAGRRAADLGRRFRIEGIHRAGLLFAAIAHGPLIDPIGLEVGATTLAAESDEPNLMSSLWGDGWSIYALLTEDRPRALRSIETAAEVGRLSRVPIPSPWWGLWPLLRAVDPTRDVEEALTAAGDVPRTGFNEMMFGYARAVSFGRHGKTAHAEAAFAEVDEPPVAWQWWRQLGRRLVAEAALQDSWGEPTLWLREVAIFFDGFPAPALASASRSMLRRAGVPAPRSLRSGHVVSVLTARGVTRREAEVLSLVGQGLSNRDVAERLFLSPRTVEKHVEHLAHKLGAATRSQLVAYAASSDQHT